MHEKRILKYTLSINYGCKILVSFDFKIQHGLITKELELTHMLDDEKLDIIFLTETDTKAISKPEDYKIPGYDTVLPLNDGKNPVTRILGLVKSNIANQITLRTELMSNNFLSIWLEHNSLFMQ